MTTSLLGWANLRAILRLWHGGTLLFDYWSDDIHFVHWLGSAITSCRHTIDYAYDGELLAEETYTIEYGFSVHAHLYSESDFYNTPNHVYALGLTIIGVLGPKNPSFEQRLMLAPGVYGVPYWSMNNEGWRELKGDCYPHPPNGNGDKKVNGQDLFVVSRAYGSYPGHPLWNPYADLNGDQKVDGRDVFIVRRDYGKMTDPVDGSYSWYTSGGGDYNISQWLCDFDVNYQRGHQVNFTFWFKPESASSGNYTRAEIYYINETGQAHINGTSVPLTETNWSSTSVTATLPSNTIAIKVIIHGQPNFRAWIDDVSISIQS